MSFDKQLLFIIGAPRSGTTWLQAMLAAHPQVCTTVELTLYSRYTSAWIETWKREAANIEQGRWVQGLPYLWTEEDLYDFFREFTKKVYQRLLDANPQASHILLKHPGYSRYVEDINRVWPEARFIHMLRDGRDVAVSMVAARRRVGFGTGTIQQSAARWKELVLAAQKAGQYQGQYLEVRYEHLLHDGVETLKSVFEFSGLPVSSQQAAKIVDEHRFKRMKAKRQAAVKDVKTSKGHYRKGQAGTWETDMTSIQRYIFHKIAGDLLYSLDYAQEDWWATSGPDRVFLPVLGRALLLGRTMRRRIFRATAELLGPELTARVRAARRRAKVAS